MTFGPDFSYTAADAETDGLIVDAASWGLTDPKGRSITYVSEGVACWMEEDDLGPEDLARFLAYAHDTACVGEPRSELFEIHFDLGLGPEHLAQHDNKGRIWIQASGDTATMHFPSEY